MAALIVSVYAISASSAVAEKRGVSAALSTHDARYVGSPPPYLFEGRPTGAWQIVAHVSPHVANGYVVYMSDTNGVGPGRVNVVLQRSGDHSISLTVNSAGCDPLTGEGELFEGPHWAAANDADRASKVLRAMQSSARSVGRSCHAAVSSLSDEVATFRRAFQLFDRWEPRTERGD